MKKLDRNKLNEFKTEQLQLLETFNSKQPADLRRASLQLLEVLGFPKGNQPGKALQKAVAYLKDVSSQPNLKIDAIRLLTLTGGNEYIALLEGLIRKEEALEVQMASLQGLSKQPYDQYQIDQFVFSPLEGIYTRCTGIYLKLVSQGGNDGLDHS